MCDEIVVYSSACVLRNKITCGMTLDYSEEEVRNVNITRSRPHPRHSDPKDFIGFSKIIKWVRPTLIQNSDLPDSRILRLFFIWSLSK